MTDATTESRLRGALARYADAGIVERPPLQEVVGRAVARDARASRSARRAVAAAVVAAAVALAGAVAVGTWREDRPNRVSTGPEDEDAASAQRCHPRQDTHGAVWSGVVPDGREWEARVSGAPPVTAMSVVLGGVPVFGGTWEEHDFSAFLNSGSLEWDLGAYGRGLFLSGMVPGATERVEVRMPDGRTLRLCPGAVRDVDVVKFVFSPLPFEESATGLVEVVALGDGGRTLAQGTVASPSSEPDARALREAIETGREAHVAFRLQANSVVDAYPPVGMDQLMHGFVRAVISGGRLASGPQWVLQTDQVPGDSSAGTFVRMGAPGLSSIDHLPMVDRAVAAGRPQSLTWHLGRAVDKRFMGGSQPTPQAMATLVWGATPPDVTTVVVSLADGRTLELPTESLDIPGVTGQVFAAGLPEGTAVTGMEGRTATGQVSLRSTGVEGIYLFDTLLAPGGIGYEALAAIAPRTDARLIVEPVD